MTKTKILAFAAAAVILLPACGNTSSNIDTVSENITEERSVSEISDETLPPEDDSPSEKTFVPDKNNVKLLGRTFLNDDILWLAQSCSGFEFSFKGSSAKMTVVGDGTVFGGGKGNYARYAVYLNGERIIDDLMKDPAKTVEIFSADEESDNIVTVVKLSEAANSSLGVKDITVVSSGNISPTPEKELKIEFIGDSITCGYGVDDEVKEHHFSTETEDGTKTYAYKTAQNLDSDYSMVCYSGHGIISGYTSNGQKQTAQLVPDFYELTAHCYIKSVSEVPWDFTEFEPDVVVINLGTNDASYCGNDPERRDDFRDSYADFLELIRSHNPDSYILCTLGIMGNDLYPSIEEAVSIYSEKTGDDKISTMMFDNQSMDDGIAADWHPSETTHGKAADKLTAEIKSILD